MLHAFTPFENFTVVCTDFIFTSLTVSLQSFLLKPIYPIFFYMPSWAFKDPPIGFPSLDGSYTHCKLILTLPFLYFPLIIMCQISISLVEVLMLYNMIIVPMHNMYRTYVVNQVL